MAPELEEQTLTEAVKGVIHKSIVIALIVMCFVGIASLVLLDEYFYRNRPREPDPASERVFPTDLKSIDGMNARVYLTRLEQLSFGCLPLLIPGFAFVGYFLNQRWNCFSPFKGKQR